MQDIIVFAVIQIINVIISTVKSIITVNGSKMTASVVNAFSYTIGAVITKLLTQQEFAVAIIVTFFTNLFGVYIAKWILEKTKKEKLWTVSATLRSFNKDAIEKELSRRGIQFVIMPALNDRYSASILSYSKGESTIIKEILSDNKVKYTITESFL